MVHIQISIERYRKFVQNMVFLLEFDRGQTLEPEQQQRRRADVQRGQRQSVTVTPARDFLAFTGIYLSQQEM